MSHGIRSGFKSLIRASLGRAGYRIIRATTLPDPYDSQHRLLRDCSNPIIFDVGGNRGDTSERYLKLFPNAIIHTFEPLPSLASQLRERFQTHSRVHVVQCALADEEGTAPFHVNPSDVQSSLLPLTDSGERAYLQPTETIDVPINTLDAYCAREHIQTIHILKMDIQGAEYKALCGARELLSAGRISSIYLECWFVPHYQNSATFHEIAALLSSFEYCVFDLFDLTRDSNGQLVKVDALFISRDIQQQLVKHKPTWSSARIRELRGE